MWSIITSQSGAEPTFMQILPRQVSSVAPLLAERRGLRRVVDVDQFGGLDVTVPASPMLHRRRTRD